MWGEKENMPLKNYTTQVPVERTIAEIEKLLAKFGATDIWKQYESGNVKRINFVINTAMGEIPFKLPANVEAVRAVLMEKRKRGLKSISESKAADINHARRVCWRIIKDWIYSQLSLIELEQIKIEQVFLPYAVNVKTNKTLFEHFTESGFAMLEEHKT